MSRVILIVSMLLSVAVGYAQKINIGYINPAGVQRGTTTTITIGGQSIATAKDVVVSGEGVTAKVIPPTAQEQQSNRKKKGKKEISDEDNMQIAQTLKVEITVAEDAEIGIRDLRVIAANGAGSNRLYFEVGQYADFVESEPNNSVTKANYIDKLPVSINGFVEKSLVARSMMGEGNESESAGKDWFSFDAKRGETIVAHVKARTFVPFLADAVPGWFQSVISLYDESGVEVAYCDDFMLGVDPTIIYSVERSGRYLLKIHDSIYRGREDFVYRIDLGVIPFITSIFPLGGERGESTDVEVRGVNLAKKPRMSITPADDADERMRVRYTQSKLGASNELYFQTQSGLNERVIDESRTPANTTDDAILIAPDDVINAKIDQPLDVDWYSIDVPDKGGYLFELRGRRLGSPIDAKLTIYNSFGKMLKKFDDTDDPSEGFMTHHADPEGLYRFFGKGRFFIRVSETQSKGGDEYGYRLRVAPVDPAFNLRIEPSSLSVPQGGVGLLTIYVERKYNFNGEIDIDFEGLPKGFEVSQTKIEKGLKQAKIAITAPMEAPTESLDLKIKGRVGEVSKDALPVEAMMQAFYITHLLPTSEFLFDITPAAPFTLRLETVDGGELQLLEDDVVPIKVVVNRQEGYTEPIQIARKIMGRGMAFDSITIPGDRSEGLIYVRTPYWDKWSSIQQIMVVGTVKASTNNRVAGLSRNTVISAVSVNSNFIDAKLPEGRPKLTFAEARKLIK